MNIKLKCQCGAVEGVAENVTPENGSRIVCCCDDCQKFAEFLGREADVLDEFGGTDIYQTSQSQVKITAGAEHIRCLRLTPGGLARWYTDCCKTPIGNTMNARVPFVGLVHSILNVEESLDKSLGSVRAHIQVKHARGNPTYPHSAQEFPLSVKLRIIRKILIWKIKGMNKPSPFYNASGHAVASATIASDN